MQYELSEKEQEYDNLYSSTLSLDPSFVPSYRPPVKRYVVTGERSNTGSSGYTKYELAPVYDYGSSNVTALHNIKNGAEMGNVEKDIEKLRSRITEIEFELSRRGLMP